MEKLMHRAYFLLCTLIMGNMNVWADSNDVTIWAENFTGLAENATPTSPTDNTYTGVTYQCVNGTGGSPGSTKIYNENLAQGTAPELMIGKKGSGKNAKNGYFKITLTTLRSAVSDYVFTYNSNNNKLDLSSSTEGVTFTKDETASSGQTYVYNVTIPSETKAIDIKMQTNSTSNVRVDNLSFTGKAGSDKASAGLFVIDDFDMYRETERNVEDLFSVMSDGIATVESSNEDIAKIEDGKLKAVAVGTATITISVAATEDYDAGSDNIVVTVKNREAIAPEGANAGLGYFLVKDVHSLADGDHVLFVGTDDNGVTKALSTEQKANNRGVTDITVSNGMIADVPDDAQVIALEKSSNYWYFNVGDGYLYAASNSNNYMKTQSGKDNNAKASINLNNTGAATIIFQGSNSHKYIKYNAQSCLFSCYLSISDMDDFYIYRYANNPTYDITIGSTGYKTLISAVSATLPDGLIAYKAVSAGEGKIQLTAVASVKAGCPYVLRGTADTDYTLTITETPEEPTGNILEVSTEQTSNGVFVLADGTNGVGFYKWMGGSLGAGRAIVPASVVAGSSREFLSFDFDEDITAIESFSPALSECKRACFDLQGRRVPTVTSHPSTLSKGLYIMNGQKVLIK